MKVLADFNPITNPVVPIDVPAGRYDGFLFYITGTTAAGQALLATDDVGTISLRIADQSVGSSSFTGLFFATMRLAGAPAQITPVAGATELSCYIPATPDKARMPNAWLCERDGMISLQWNSGANLIAELTTTPRVQVYGIQSRAIPLFLMKFAEISEAVVAGGPIPLKQPRLYNCTDVFFRPNTPGNMARLTIKRGDLVEWDASYNASYSLSNILDKIEIGEVPGVADAAAAVPVAVHATLGHERSLGAAIGPEVNITLQTTGADTVNPLYFALQFLGNRAESGKSSVEAEILSIARKIPRNQARNFVKVSFLSAGRSSREAEELAKRYGF